MTQTRIRQLVFATTEYADIEHLRHVLALGKPFVDPGVAAFGLTNGVFSLGDQFLEIVVPVQADTAAGRFLSRSRGIGGYMAIFQTDDLRRVRETADAMNIRRVWNIDLPDIAASHLHPADIGGAIVSIDQADPEDSWRWGGPDWQDHAIPGQLIRLDVTALSPQILSAKWGHVLGAAPIKHDHDVFELETRDGSIFVSPGERDCLSAYTLTHSAPAACLKRAQELGWPCNNDSFEFAGVKVQLTAIDPSA